MFRRSGPTLAALALTALFAENQALAGVPWGHPSQAPQCGSTPAARATLQPSTPRYAQVSSHTPRRNQPAPPSWPPPLIYVPLVYDPDEGTVLMAGGQHYDVPWLEPYVRALGAQARLKLPNGARAPRRQAERAIKSPWKTIGPMLPEYDLVTYDVAAGRMIVTVSFLWNSLWEAASQTWSFDPATGAWEELNPADSPPSGLCGCGSQAAYDAHARKTVVFGGIDIVAYFSCLEQGCTDEEWMATESNDTWVYDYPANQWTKMPRPVDGSQLPGPRNSHALAYDPDTDRMLLFGGDNGLVSYDDTWMYDYDTNTWTRIETDLHPSARDYGQLVYDADMHRMVLFGGVYYANPEETLCEPETWAFDFTTMSWEMLTPPTSPTARAWHGMAYSESAGAVVLYGGGPLRETPSDELWLYSGKKDRWVQVPKD